MLKKLFKARPSYHWNIIEKETVDEVIFRTLKPRNRLMLELMARGGMRISEVLKLAPSDIHERRLTLREPKSGREQEFIFIPQCFLLYFKKRILILKKIRFALLTER